MKAKQVSQTIDVRYVEGTPAAAPRLEIDPGAVLVPKECNEITWRLHDAPADLVSLDVAPLPQGWSKRTPSCHEVTASGPAVGENWFLDYRASVSTVEGGGTFHSELRQVAVPTVSAIAVTVTLNGPNDVTVSIDPVVLANDPRTPHPPVQWSFVNFTATAMSFTDPSGTNNATGPFATFDTTSTPWTGKGNSGVFGHFTYEITGKVKGGSSLSFIVDPGICNLAPPPARFPPPCDHGRRYDEDESQGVSSTVALPPPAGSAAPAAPGRP